MDHVYVDRWIIQQVKSVYLILTWITCLFEHVAPCRDNLLQTEGHIMAASPFSLLYIYMVVIYLNKATILFCFSWDESSSISSGLSEGDGDGSENLSSEEFNASSSLNSLPSTPLGSRRNSSVMVSWNTVPCSHLYYSVWQSFSFLCLVCLYNSENITAKAFPWSIFGVSLFDLFCSVC